MVTVKKVPLLLYHSILKCTAPSGPAKLKLSPGTERPTHSGTDVWKKKHLSGSAHEHSVIIQMQSEFNCRFKKRKNRGQNRHRQESENDTVRLIHVETV